MFIPRHPVIENQFCKYAAQTGTGAAGLGGVIAYAGSVVYLKSDAVNQESEVLKMAYNASPFTPFGFLMQKVKTGYHQVHPAGFVMPGDLGSSDVIAQPTYNSSGVITGTRSVPVGVAHMGIWDTVHYMCVLAGGVVQAAMLPGDSLFPAAADARVTKSTVDADGSDTAGERCSTTVVARVMTGASVAKCQATIDNTALYPIRIKLLI
jgi:hypothetical protein